MGVSLLSSVGVVARARGRSGQTALSLVFVIGTVVTIVGATIAFLIFSFLNSSFGFQAAQRASAVASAGVHDALLRLARDKDFEVLGPDGYDVSVGGETAQVTVVQNAPGHKATITSEATVLLRRRMLEVIVSLAPSTGQVEIASWKQM